MEKFQIAKYGVMQVTAVAYGVLGCGVFYRIHERILRGEGLETNGMHRAWLFSRYGLLLFIVVLGWTAAVSYLSSGVSPWECDGDKLAMTGLVLAILLALLSSFFVFGAFASLFSPVV